MKRFLFFAVAALLFVACDNKFEDEPSVNEEDVTLRFTATCSEDVPHLKWDKGDKMSLFLANTYNNKFVFERVEKDNAYFIPADENNIGDGDALDRIYAVYPYDTNISVSNNGVISLKLSDVQSYEVDGFDPYYNSAVAVTKSEEDRVLNFKGIYGYVTIPLYGDATVESVEIRGNNGEKIAGDITILATPTGTPEIYTSERGEESILLDCGDGVTLSTDAENPTEFWFIIPPMRFDSGISLIIHCGEKGDFEPTISKAFVVERNKDISLEAIEVKFKPEVELVNNEIFYTSTDGKIVTPNKSDRFGANITSNTYDDGQGVITFDGEVSRIGDYAFFDCKRLATIVIPNGVTTIGENAFEYCHGLTDVTIPNSVTHLANGAFYGCTSLESITIPESVTVIEEWTFADCTMLTSVYCKMATPSSGGIGIFENNAEDRKIYVPVGSGKAYKTANAWKEYAYAIREYDFESGEVIVEDPVLTLTSESEISFSADGGNGEIGYTLENPVEGINVVADSDAEWITNFAVAKDKIIFKVANNTVVEPRTATINVKYGVLSFNVKITQEAKAGQSNNEIWYTSSDGKIVEPYKTNVFGANIVSNNYKDGKGVITFDGNVTTIGNYAFYYCDSLTSVTIPDSVTTIGYAAFRDCDSLTSVTIGDSVTTIGYEAFRSCESLTSVTIPDSVTRIGDYAFEYCDSLTSVTIGDSVTTIGDYVFYSCDSLTSVTIGDSVTTIGSSAFAYCSSLKEFKGKFAADNGRCLIVDGVLNYFAIGCGATDYTIPNSVTTIGNWAFCNCDSLTSVTIGDSVTTIGKYAFKDCDSLTSVTIGDKVTKIGYEAFRDCTSLTSVTIGDSVTTIGSSAFAYCRSLTSVTIGDSVTTIEDEVFRDCTSLTSVTIGDSVTKIGRSAFYSCKKLTSVTIGDSVTTIGNSAFYYCTSLTSVTIGDSVTTIGDYAFYNCDSLTSVTIPDSVTTIGSSAFAYCRSLTSVTIPDSVTTIGNGAFYCCSKLKYVYSKPTIPPSMGSSVFYNTNIQAIYVPTGSVEAYKAKTNWTDYADRIVGYDF